VVGQGKSQEDSKLTADFLITQFSVLASHVIGLLNAATQRIAAYLVFVGLVFTAVSVVTQTRPEREIYILVALIGVGLVGFVIWYRTIGLLTQVILYLRIMNGIRGYFAEHSPHVERLSTKVLPTSSDLPKWNQPIFDPGLAIVDMILAITMALLIFNILAAAGITFTPISRNILIAVLSAGVWVIIWQVKMRMLRAALNTNHEEQGGVSNGKQASDQ